MRLFLGWGTRRIFVDEVYFLAHDELMAERGYLGEFELMLLLAVIQLDDEAYGVPISRELEARVIGLDRKSVV